jgi:hypothetical protein
VIYEQLVINSVGMIEISALADVERQILQIAVIGVLLNENDFAGTDRLKNSVGDGRLAGARTSGNSDYHAH